MTRQHHYLVNITPPEGDTIVHQCSTVSDAISIVEEYAPDVFCTPITCWRSDQEHTGYAGFYLEYHEQHADTIEDDECPCETATGGTVEWGYPTYWPSEPGSTPDPYYYTTHPLPETAQNLHWFTECVNQWNEEYSILVEETITPK